MSLKGSMPSASMILRRGAVMAPDREFLAKAPTHVRGRECLSRSIGRQAGKGAFDRVVVCFAHDYCALPDEQRKTCDEDGYRFLGEFWLGATSGLLTGTMAPFDASPAALARVRTSC